MIYKTICWDSDAQEQRERDCTSDEVAEIEARKASSDVVNAPTLARIATLEATVTPRRIREALTTAPGKTWLVAVDSQIAALRGSLVK